MKFDIEASLGYSTKTYKTESGNGTAIPLHKQDEKLGRMVPLLKKNGRKKTKNLYLEIQKAKSSTDYKKFVEKLDFDLEAAKMIFKNINPQEAFNNAVDYTNFGGIETYKALENKIVGRFGSLDNYYKFVNQKINKFNQQLTKTQNVKNEIKKAEETKK